MRNWSPEATGTVRSGTIWAPAERGGDEVSEEGEVLTSVRVLVGSVIRTREKVAEAIEFLETVGEEDPRSGHFVATRALERLRFAAAPPRNQEEETK